MKNERVMSLEDINPNITFTIEGLYFFQGFQVIEAYKNDGCYYAFYYKNQFLTEKKTTKIKRNSTLAKILTQGVYIPSPHPLLNSFTSKHPLQQSPTLNVTWKKINKTYPKVEAAYILTAFDCYVKKENLIFILKDICLQFRRDGDFLNAYRILRLVVEKYPTNEWARSLISHLDYYKYSLHYQSDPVTLLKYDSIYAENQLYSNKESAPFFHLLQKKLRSESREQECLALYFARLTKETQQFSELFHEFIELLSAYYSEQESLSILQILYKETISTENKAIVQVQYLSILWTSKQYQEIFTVLAQHKEQLSKAQMDLFLKALHQLGPSYSIPFELINTNNLVHADKVQLEQLMLILIPRLFEKNNITYVYNWLKPLLHLSLASFHTIKTMYHIQEEPDQQFYLGQLYYQLDQLPQAVDCFLWDIEMNPSSSKPIKWLIKVYRELGMLEESKTYQHLYKLVQKSS
ncbi:hypothetical protein [Peribacillus kribbensis]|uniref:hypothetical protein n=1 Tax=Peribacillus kribbensis TaxID=356658 RepID=UPI0004248D2F|nr:hypothetical protein [Peribacillus kribbensis]